MPSDPSREGYADDWEDKDPASRKPEVYRPPVRGLPTAENLNRPMEKLNTREIPPEVKRYQTPGPGPSSGIPQKCLELSSIEKQVEDIRAILKRGAVRPGNQAEAGIKTALFKIELSTAYLQEH